VTAVGDEHTGPTAAARPFIQRIRLAVQRHRKGSGQRGFANLPGAGNQISVADTIMYNRPTKQIYRPFMPDDPVPNAHAIILTTLTQLPNYPITNQLNQPNQPITNYQLPRNHETSPHFRSKPQS
jgi:hypothetical protein